MTDTAPAAERRLLTLTRSDMRVVFEHIGEGYNGDYDPADPTDDELLRFTVQQLHDGNWHDVECGSYCTHLTLADSPGCLPGRPARSPTPSKRRCARSSRSRRAAKRSAGCASPTATCRSQPCGANPPGGTRPHGATRGQ